MLTTAQRCCALEGYKQYNIVQMRWKSQQDDSLRPHEQLVFKLCFDKFSVDLTFKLKEFIL